MEGLNHTSINNLIRHITGILLSESNVDRGINKSLEIIQSITQVDRVYIFEVFQNIEGNPLANQVFEYCAEGVDPEIDNPQLQNLELIPQFERWHNAFLQGSWIGGHIVDFPQSEQLLLEPQKILSLLVIPIKVENHLIGFMGFDSTTVERIWSLNEVELLIESSVLIGTLLLRRKQEAKLNRLKSNLLSNISHEFRTPLTGILGFSKLIQDSSVQDNILHYAAQVEQSAKRLQYTLENVLEFSYLESASIEFRPQQIHISETLQSVVSEYRAQAEIKKLGFTVQFSGDDVIYCDGRHLKTIVAHLLQNAIKFTNEGEVQLLLDVRKDNCIIEVHDSGIGISEPVFHSIFDPFTQLSDGLGRGFEGTGLGLPIVKKLLDLLNGTIQVTKNTFGGSTFRIQIPRTVEHLHSSAHPVVGKFDLMSDRVLYVEDNPILRKLIRSTLSEFNVTTVPTAEEALKLLHDQSFGLFLIDINLGAGMNGIELAKWIRGQPKFTGCVIAAITAYSMDQLSEHLDSGVFNYYLSKPFDQVELLQFIRSIHMTTTNETSIFS